MLHGDWLPTGQARAFQQISFQWEGKNGHLASAFHSHFRQTDGETFKAISKSKIYQF